MKIQTRILVLLAVLIGAFTMALFFLRKCEHGRLEMIKIQQRQEKQHVFAQLIKMKAMNAESMAKDYSIWDEMVDFVSTGDKEWAKSNVDGSIESFNISAFWIYDLQSRLVHFRKNKKYQGLDEAPMMPPEIEDVFHGRPFTSFFVRTEAGIMDIHGATINYVADPERKKPYGYILIGRLWDQDFIDDLAAITGTRVYVLPDANIIPFNEKHKSIGEISFIHVLKDFEGRPVAKLLVSFHSDMISRADKVSETVSVMFFSFSIALFVLISLALLFWISLPLRKISLALSQENMEAINSLENNQSEMGAVARMIKRFFLQKQKLWSEMQERALAEKNLQTAYEDLQVAQQQLIAKKHLEAMYEMQKDFTSTVSHELRTPLASIKTAIDLVVKEMVGPISREQAEVLGRAKNNVDRLKRLIDDILDLNRIESGRLQIKFVMNNIEQVIKDVVESQKHVAQERGLGLKLQLESPISDIAFDRDRIIQVLNNLLNNAIKFTKSGEILIRTKGHSDEGYVVVSVTDTGRGIAEADMARLFQKFQQIESAEKNEEGGTGLGLAICKEIITRHGGRIWAESRLGEGTTVSFTLPIKERRMPV